MKKIKGFTLVELVIVIAIVIILSVVSVPIYRGYMRNAKMAEGYALLGTILSAQKAYYSQYGNFIHINRLSGGTYTNNEEVLGVNAIGNKYFTSFSAGSIVKGENTKYHFYAIAIKPEELRISEDKSLLMLYYSITGNGGATFLDDQAYGN